MLDVEIARRAKQDPVARRLMTIPGIGPVTATADRGAGASAGGFQVRARLRGLAGADAAAEVDRRQAEARVRSRRWASERCAVCW